MPDRHAASSRRPRIVARTWSVAVVTAVAIGGAMSSPASSRPPWDEDAPGADAAGRGIGERAPRRGPIVGPDRVVPIDMAPRRATSVRVIADGDTRPIAIVALWTRPHPDLSFMPTLMEPVPGLPGRWEGVVPCAACRSIVEWYVEAVDTSDRRARWPPRGPDAPASIDVGIRLAIEPMAEPDPSPRDPTVGGTGSGRGRVPSGAPGFEHPVGWDARPTARSIGLGETIRFGPWDLGWADMPVLRFERVIQGDDPGAFLLVELSGDGGATWEPVERVEMVRTPATLVRTETSQVWPGAETAMLRVRVVGRGSTPVRAWIDRVVMDTLQCTSARGPDVDGDGLVGLGDLLMVLANLGPCGDPSACAADVDGSGVIDFLDLLEILVVWSEWTPVTT